MRGIHALYRGLEGNAAEDGALLLASVLIAFSPTPPKER